MWGRKKSPKYALSATPGFLKTFATKLGADRQSSGLIPTPRPREAVESFFSLRQRLIAPAAKGCDSILISTGSTVHLSAPASYRCRRASLAGHREWIFLSAQGSER